jgi:transcriptional regulator with XRE-family HTH domain
MCNCSRYTCQIHKLTNYLRSNRKRLGLSQDEVAFLLGTQSGAKVCRYEKFTREPNLATALACEAIFQKPVRELFAGLYQEVEREVAGRAKVLTHRTNYQNPTNGNTRKLQVLAGIGNQLGHSADLS